VRPSDGILHRLARAWLVDSSPPSQHDKEEEPTGFPTPDEVDYAFLRLSAPAGLEPVGGRAGDSNGTPRGFVRLPVVEHSFARNPNVTIVQYMGREPLTMAYTGLHVTDVNANGTRVRYLTMTQSGSSGAPCFSADLEWVAMHQAADPRSLRGERARFNQGVPVEAIRRRLLRRDLLHLLSAPSGEEPRTQ
jgi:hypothetical protein